MKVLGAFFREIQTHIDIIYIAPSDRTLLYPQRDYQHED